MSRLRWPSRAAMASRLMPRLMAWVARVWRSWWGWMWLRPAAAPARLIIWGTAWRSSGRPCSRGDQQRVTGRDVRGPVVVDEGDQLGVQSQVAVLAELAD